MKYWIYKDARILGPFERDAMAGLPGFDAGTMVCAGETAGAAEGQWSPAADVPDLAPLTLAHGPTWTPDAPASSFGLLDKLQIESAGLIGDDQYPSAAEVLFQDAEIKKSFAELLVARTRTDDTEVRRLRGLVSELSVQLELMYRRIAQLENTHTDFLRRLTSPDALARPAGEAAPVPASAPASVPAPAPAPAAPAAFVAAPANAAPAARSSAEPFVPAVLPAAPAAPVVSAGPAFSAPAAPLPVAPGAPAAPFAAEWPAPAATAEFPSFSAPKPDVSAAESARAEPEIPPLKPSALAGESAPVPIEPVAASSGPSPASPDDAVPLPPLPPIPEFNPAADAAASVPLPPLPEPVPAEPSVSAEMPAPTPAPTAPRKLVFDKPKTLRIVPTLKAFRVVGAADAVPEEHAPAPAQASVSGDAAPEAPTEAISPEALPPMPSLAPTPAAPEAVAAAPELAPGAIPPPPFLLAGEPAPIPIPAASPIPVPIPAPAAAAPIPAPAAGPVPLPAPEAGMPRIAGFPATGSLPVAGPAASSALEPPSTAVFSAGEGVFAAAPSAPATQEVLARLAKPAASPASAPPRPPRSNKKFLLVGGVLVAALFAALALFLRRTRASDLNHMAALDDGKPQLGAEPLDDSARPAIANSPLAPAPAAPVSPAPAAAPTAPTAPAAPAGPAMTAATAAPPAFPPAAGGAASPTPGAEPAPAAPAVEPAPTGPSPLDTATSFVEGFPLDGNRGTVSKWLDFSYMATPDAGQGVWSANQQSDGTFLVEYHFVPAVKDAPEILYLFEADPQRGYVLGKNSDARDLLAGGGSGFGSDAAAKPKRKKRRAARRRAASRRTESAGGDAAPNAVPQLPLPTEGELRAPAEDDGDFGSDTVKSDQ